MRLSSWIFVHKWTSLICTLFLLMLCLTGLPLVFTEEIEHLSGVVEAPEMAEGTPKTSMDRIVESALAAQPGKVVRYMFWDEDEHPNVTLVSMASRIDAPPEEYWLVSLDSRTAQVLDQPNDRGFMHVMLQLHKDMYAGLPGQLFLGLMGLMFVVAIVSGVVLYKPFMRKLDFGTVRRLKTSTKWLDLHNLLGIVTVVWLTVVGVTGVINTLDPIVLALWQRDQLTEMVGPYMNEPPLDSNGSAQAALDTAGKAVPDMKTTLLAFPGTVFASPHHYTIFMKGNTPLTSKLLRPVLVDAQTAVLTDTREMPWYVKTLFISQPLHFGDYGGLPLKIIWALLDIVAIIVLGSGVYLWIKKYARRKEASAVVR
ncbi:PepSY domain-containing protein [Bordetella tumbae]|uniref:PepSY-associated TM helix domain-containing protein n=1 Tax=Bordetella tumbae TaxID=1649139 RepID=UPI0039F00B8E